MTLLKPNGERLLKVAIAVPCLDQVATDFAFSFAQMVGYTVAVRPDIGVGLYRSRGTLIQSSRSGLVNEIIGDGGFTHVLWLDSDMVFPRDALLQLLAREKPVVAANYATRKTNVPITTVAGEVGGSARLYIEPDSTGLTPVKWIGMGCMLVDMEVYEKMPKPWFMVGYNPKQDAFSGEDIYFCQRAWSLGYEVLVDMDLSKQVEHVGTLNFKHEHARAHRDAALLVAQEAEAASGAE